jgi:hypothetical protein
MPVAEQGFGTRDSESFQQIDRLHGFELEQLVGIAGVVESQCTLARLGRRPFDALAEQGLELTPGNAFQSFRNIRLVFVGGLPAYLNISILSRTRK